MNLPTRILMPVFIIFAATLAGSGAAAQVSPVQLSYLPTARAGMPDTPITIFATVVNAGDEEMMCSPQSFNLAFLTQPVPDGIIGQVRFYAIDNGVITSGANQDVAIPAGGSQDFIAELRVNAEYTGIVRSRVRCFGDTDSGISTRYPLVNDILLTVSNDPQPDIIMIGDTLTNDGVARVGATGPRAALMTVAAVNIGNPGTNLEVIGSIGGFPGLDRNIPTRICEVDAAGTCLAAESESVTIANWLTNEVRLFAVRARFPGDAAAAFYPDNIRLFAAVRSQISEADQPGIANDSDGILYDEQPESARTSVAMDVEIGEAFFHIWQPDEPPVATFGCEMRNDFDTTGGLTGLQTGRLTIMPDGNGGAVGHGWSQINAGRQAYSITIPDWSSQDGTFTLYGSEGGSPSPADGSMPINFQRDHENLAVGFSFDGNSDFSNDFFDAGRMRCSAFPAGPNEPGIDEGPDGLIEGQFSEYDATGNSALVASQLVGWQVHEDESRTILPTDRVSYIAYFNQQLERNDRVNIGDAFIAFFAYLDGGRRDQSTDAPQSHTPTYDGIVYPGLLRDDNGTPRADCYTIVAADNLGSDAEADAQVILGVRDGADLDAAIESCLN